MLLGHDYSNQPVFLSEHDLDRHGYMIGLPGTGKTTMLLTIAAGIVSEKWGGMIVLDPHGDMSYDLLNMLPPSAADRVILFDPVDQLDHPFGLNLFDIPDPKRIDVSADWAVMALKKAIASDTTWPMTADRVARHLFYCQERSRMSADHRAKKSPDQRRKCPFSARFGLCGHLLLFFGRRFGAAEQAGPALLLEPIALTLDVEGGGIVQEPV
jgi:hypothetical protein